MKTNFSTVNLDVHNYISENPVVKLCMYESKHFYCKNLIEEENQRTWITSYCFNKKIVYFTMDFKTIHTHVQVCMILGDKQFSA